MIHTAKPTTFLTHLLAAMLLAFSIAPRAAAQPDSTDLHISATLEAATDPAPGQPFILALTLTIDDGWHTYWPGINDTGYGISLTFDPVPGLTLNDPVFPTPTRHIAPGNILDHIYENQITIYIPAQLDDTFAPGDQLIINTTIDYLICKEVCIPESIDLSKELKVLVTEHAFLAHVQATTFSNMEFPSALNDDNYTPFNSHGQTVIDGEVIEYVICGRNFAEHYWNDNEARLNLDGATHYTFFPDTNCTNPADLITQGDTESNTLTITFDRQYEDDPTTPARLSGRLRVKIKDTWHEYDVDYNQPTQTETTP